MVISRLVREGRRAAGLTQAELCREAGITGPTLRNLEIRGAGFIASLDAVDRVLRIPLPGLPQHGPLGPRVRRAREARRMSGAELAKRARLGTATLRAIEAGQGRVASLAAVVGALAPSIRVRAPRLPSSAAVAATSGSARILAGDCRDVMASLEPESIALIATSPPYGLSKAYEFGEHGGVEAYRKFAEAWMAPATRLLTPTGTLMLNVGSTQTGPTTTLPLDYIYVPIAQSLGLSLVQRIVWGYSSGRSLWRRYSHRYEVWLWLVRDPHNFTFNLDDIRDSSLNTTIDPRNHALGRSPSDLWLADRERSEVRGSHPSVVPKMIAERVVRGHSRHGSIILDPFAGSGAIGRAAIDLGRAFVGIERDASYVATLRQKFYGEAE